MFVFVLSATALVAPVAAAAAPANDNFAGREPLAGPLPITASGSNVGAGPEAEEPSYAFDEAAGHSVWFSWTASSTKLVTVGTCGSGFGSLVDVYTGTTLGMLERVSQWHEGPSATCAPDGSQVTFRAFAGSTYAIRVDGNLSPQASPLKEGPIALQIEPTPAAANDAFAAARTVTAESLEGGHFYRVDVSGFNWNATTEPAEPSHGGDPGGASVWYSWTAPASGDAKVNVVGGTLHPLIGVYTGDSVATLTRVATTALFPPEISLPVSAGTTYRFAVDGRYDILSGYPSMGSFTFLVYLDVPASESPGTAALQLGPAPAVDRTAPDTAIVKRRIRPGKRSATLAFSSTEQPAGFLCKLDARRETKCGSPSTYAGLAPGSHTFKVRAVDQAGNADPTPAISRFAIAVPQRPHR